MEYSILRMAEKMYRAQDEVERLKEQIREKDAYIKQIEEKMEAIMKENKEMREKVTGLESGGKGNGNQNNLIDGSTFGKQAAPLLQNSKGATL